MTLGIGNEGENITKTINRHKVSEVLNQFHSGQKGLEKRITLMGRQGEFSFEE